MYSAVGHLITVFSQALVLNLKINSAHSNLKIGETKFEHCLYSVHKMQKTHFKEFKFGFNYFGFNDYF